MDLVRTASGFRIVLREPLLDEVHVDMPGWERAEEAPDFYSYKAGELVCSVRIRREPNFGLDVEITNDGAVPVVVSSPLVRLVTPGPQLAWLGGATGRVLLPSRTGGGSFRQWRGICGGARSGVIELFGPSSWVQPGLTVGSGWRLEPTPSGALPPDPPWVPDRFFVPYGEEITLSAPDAAIWAGDIQVEEEVHVTALLGEPGVHAVQLSDARGTTHFEVGWYEPLEWIVARANPLADHPGLLAWFMVAGGGSRLSPGDLDVLDLMLAEGLETGNLWAVLAGVRAASVTDLPVRAEAEVAARRRLSVDPTAELAPLLWTAGLVLGDPEEAPEDSAAAQWWRVLTRDDEYVRQEVLGYVGHGRYTSRPPRHGARGVALACLWLATRENGNGQLEVARAVANATARLLAINSIEPDPTEVAWLLLANSFSAEI